MTLDFGGRSVTITPMAGHTASDLAICDQQTQVTFSGDLAWDGIFPNFISSSPQQWINSVKQITATADQIIVPGHGGICKSDSDKIKKYRILLEEIQSHARTEFDKGTDADGAAHSFKLPKSVGDFHYFREGFHEIAMRAWYKELSGG